MVQNICRIASKNVLCQHKNEEVCDFSSTRNSCGEADELPIDLAVKKAVVLI
jgi:hypothetical protein